VTTSQDRAFEQRLIRDQIADVQALIDAEQARLDTNPADFGARIRLFGLRGRLQRLQAEVAQ